MSIRVITAFLAGFPGNSGRPHRSDPIGIMSLCKHPKSSLDRRRRHRREPLPILDEADDPHGALAFWANQWIDLINFQNQLA